MHLFVSTRKGLFRLEPSAGSWKITEASFLGQNVTLSHRDRRDGSLYAALNLGHFGVKLHRSTDHGATWTELPVPVYPEGFTVATWDGKPPIPASLKLIWSLESDGQGRLWAGTAPGGLFYSDDGAQSWNLVESLWNRPERSRWFGGGYDYPAIHSICIDPRDRNVIRVALSCGGAWITRDAGQTWQVGEGMFAEFMPPEHRYDPVVQDPHQMVQCPTSPDHLWVQHHNGIFRSVDGGYRWEHVSNVSPSSFGFAVAVHPHNPDCAWFVPAVKDEIRIPVTGQLVVNRTRDGGKSFETLRHGLPQEHCYDLVYRHGLDLDETGETLAFGSTTGGLWLSSNGGDSWQTLSATLPPIHAVRFG